MASAVSGLTGAPSPTTSATSNSSPSSSSGSLSSTTPPSEEMFLNLLVAQIQNQDPLNPTDSTQFVSQLAQFSELEQVIGIRSDIESQMSASALAQANNTASQGNGTTTPTTSTSNSTSSTGQTTSATTY